MATDGKAGAAPPNAGHIVSKDDGDLHDIMEMCKRSLAFCEEELPGLKTSDASLKEDLVDLRSILTGLDDRLKKLDGQTDHSDKIWRAETPWHTRAYRDIGNIFTASFKAHKTGYREIPEGYVRATDQTSGGDGTLGGVMVPEITYDKIGYILGEKSLARLLCTVVPMTSDTMNAPILDDGPIVYYVGQGTEPTHSVLTFSKQTLNVKTLMAINVISLELTEDMLPAYEPFWAMVFTDQFCLKENKAVFSETAADAGSAFTGVVQAVVAADSGVKHLNYLGGAADSGKTNFSLVSFGDLNATQFSINENAVDGAVWVCNKAALRYMAGIVDNQGRPIFNSSWNGLQQVNPLPNTMGPRSTIMMGDPLYVTGAMPSTTSTAGKAMVIYGNFKYHFFGDRRQMAMAWSDEAAFTSGARVMRMRERYASTNVLVDAFATLNNAST